jgi:acyl carrier protein
VQFLADELSTVHAWQAPHASINAPLQTECYVAPRTKTEEQLAEAWSEVLGIERVGVLDNFFDLGGHSLMATQLINRLSPRFGIEIPLAELFDRPTVAALAELIDARRIVQSATAIEERLLAELENMTEAEANALLAREITAPAHRQPAQAVATSGRSAAYDRLIVPTSDARALADGGASQS